MHWNGRKIGTYSAVTTAILGAFIYLLFGHGLFGCRAGNFENCLSTIALTILALYVFIYACFWFFTRFGNLQGVHREDEF